MSESEAQARIRLAVGKHAPHVRLFRNNRGLFWAGKVLRRDANTVTLANPRAVECGLINGASDLIGWTSLTVTPEMVGQRIAVFTGAEVKTKTGKSSVEQTRFIGNVSAAGGIAGIVRSEADALALVQAPR